MDGGFSKPVRSFLICNALIALDSLLSFPFGQVATCPYTGICSMFITISCPYPPSLCILTALYAFCRHSRRDRSRPVRVKKPAMARFTEARQRGKSAKLIRFNPRFRVYPVLRGCVIPTAGSLIIRGL